LTTGPGAGGHHLAAVHDDQIVGHLAREVEILLDQKDRQAAAPG
jgi:hypothetical protein